MKGQVIIPNSEGSSVEEPHSDSEESSVEQSDSGFDAEAQHSSTYCVFRPRVRRPPIAIQLDDSEELSEEDWMSCRSYRSNTSSLEGLLDAEGLSLESSSAFETMDLYQEIPENLVRVKPAASGLEVSTGDFALDAEEQRDLTQTTQRQEPRYGSSLGNLREVFAHPRSSLWRNRSANLAVVVFPRPKRTKFKGAPGNVEGRKRLVALEETSSSRPNTRSNLVSSRGSSLSSVGDFIRIIRASKKSNMAPERRSRRVSKKVQAPTTDIATDTWFEEEDDEDDEYQEASLLVDDSEASDDQDFGKGSKSDEPAKKRRKLSDGKATTVNKTSVRKTAAKKDAPSKKAAARKSDKITSPGSSSASGGKRKRKTPGAKTTEDKKPPNFFDDDKFEFDSGLGKKYKPLKTIPAMFTWLVDQAISQKAFQILMDNLKGSSLKIGTMCSGSEICIIAWQYIMDLVKARGHEMSFDHLFSAEIVAWKQAYIYRNFGTTVFRDIVEMATQNAGHQGPWHATTSFGSQVEVPNDLDILITGFCCVDYSNLNGAKKTLEEKGESGDTLCATIAYVKRARPKMVIFENVVGAPWIDEKLRKKDLATVRKLLMMKNKDPGKLAEIMVELDLEDDGESEDDEASGRDNQNATPEEDCENEEGKKVSALSAELIEQVVEKTLALDDLNSGTDYLIRGIDWRMDKAGYYTRHVKLDTKNYNLPQTRNRGYMVCIRKDLVSVHDIEKHWDAYDEFLTKTFKSTATVSAEELILSTAEGTMSIPGKLDNSEEKKPVPWISCEKNHLAFREEMGFGQKRRLTNWLESGAVKKPDFWVVPAKMLTQRVYDVTEINHLRNIQRGFDDRYYSRLLELSQNVYRGRDSLKSDIIMCLTPSGIPWMTTQGRRLTGREALTLQGMPIDRMDLSHLSEAQLQDFCGNAMSGTVVATVQMSALLAFPEIFRDGQQTSSPLITKMIAPRRLAPLTRKPHNPFRASLNTSTETLIQRAEASSALCLCEGREKMLSKIFVKCGVCGHTVCKLHSGNPKHNFAKIDIGAREPPAEFVAFAEQYLPKKIQFAKITGQMNDFYKQHKSNIDKTSWYSEAIEDAFAEDLFIKPLKRGVGRWDIFYESKYAKLILTLANGCGQWKLFAKPDDNLPANSKKREHLESQPIARLSLSADTSSRDLLAGKWEIFLPKERAVEATVTWSGDMLPSFWCDRGVQSSVGSFSETFVFNTCAISVAPGDEQVFEAPVSGTYELHQACGQAFNSLHVRDVQKGQAIIPDRNKETVAMTKSSNSERPLYMFYDHTAHRGDYAKHGFVLSNDTSRTDYGHRREVIARLEPSFHQALFFRDEASGVLTHHTKLNNLGKPMYDGDMETRLPLQGQSAFGKYNMIVDGSWEQLAAIASINEALEIVDYHQVTKEFSPPTSCTHPSTIFRCLADVPATVAERYPRNEEFVVDRKNEVDFHGDLNSIIKPGSFISPFDSANDHTWHQLSLSQAERRCNICFPDHPSILWAESKGKKDKEAGKLDPFEKPDEAARFERELKARAPPILRTCELTETDGGNHRMVFEASINPVALIHEAAGILESRSRLGSVYQNIKTSWRLISNALPTVYDVAGPYEISNTSKVEPMPEVHISGVDIWPEQATSIAWQLSQERKPAYFTEVETIEVQTPYLGWYLSGRASREVLVRGGSIASDVGFGKTLIMIAMILRQRNFDAQNARRSSPGRIAVKATLVVVPNQIVGQWESEFYKFWGNDPKIITILNIKKLRSLTVDDVENADIIIVSQSVLMNQGYQSDLAINAGMLELRAKSSERAKDTWMKTAMRQLRDNVDELVQNGRAAFIKMIADKLTANHLNAAGNEFPVPTKRTRGKKYLEKKANDQKKAAEAKVVNEAEDNDRIAQDCKIPTEVKGVVFELFDFARVIIDEWHYLNEPSAADAYRTLAYIARYCTWLLSATPSFNSHAQVSRAATLLGVNLGSPDLSELSPNDFKKAMDGLTTTEKVLAMKAPTSNRFREERYRHGEDFVKQFVRQDVTSRKFEYVEHVDIVHQDAAERLTYLDHERDLVAKQFEVPTSFAAEDKCEVKFQVVQQLQSGYYGYASQAFRALMRRSSRFDPFLGVASDTAPFDPLEFVISRRRANNRELVAHIKHDMRHYWFLTTRMKNEADAKVLRKEIKSRVSEIADPDVLSALNDMLNDVKDDIKDGRVFEADFYVEKDSIAENGPFGRRRSLHGGTELYQGRKVSRINVDLRVVSGLLVNRVKALVLFCRALRLSAAVKDATVLARGDVEYLVCSAPGCRTPFIEEVTDLNIATVCGHHFCGGCRSSSDTEDERACTVCQTPLESHGIISAVEFTTKGRLKYPECPMGVKMEAVVEHMERIQNDDEKALIFAPDSRTIEDLAAALEYAKIRFSRLDKAAKGTKLNPSKILEDFKANKDNSTVLLLDISSSSAAGSTLTIANHVVFFSPYFTQDSEGKSKYVATMKQARGRALRYGQKKIVHIHQYVTARTFEVDYLEYREDSKLVQCEQGKWIFVKRAVDDDSSSELASHIVKLLPEDMDLDEE